MYGGSAVEVAGSGLGVNDAIGIGIGFISMLGELCICAAHCTTSELPQPPVAAGEGVQWRHIVGRLSWIGI